MTKPKVKPDKRPLREKLEWSRSKNNRVLLCKMTRHHIQNAVIILAKKQEDCDKYHLGDYESCAGITANQWIAIFRNELAYRLEHKIVIKEDETETENT